ncbi:class II aldolase/adducin family protein [Candidatus Bathyarchaeota archaeon]|nr:class II aldolase/adducin family protein [Candidatus Bathyarchaeota archaeon]
MFRRLDEEGLNYGRSGNISVRIKGEAERYFITPSGVPKATLKEEDILLIDREGNIVEGERNPSIEVKLHVSIYRRYPHFNAIIHAHPIYSLAFAATRKSIPVFLEEMVYYTGGDVRVAEYAPSGSPELAENVVRALEDRSAVLLANHGVITCGPSLEEAYDVLVCVERAAKIYFLSTLVGGLTTLPQETLELEREIYKLKLEGW